MTDKELIRALRCCGKLNKACGACPADNLCQFDGGQTAHEEAADRLESLIAEIERLKAQNWEEYCHDLHEYHCPSVPKWHPASEPPEEYRDEYGELKCFLVCAENCSQPFRAFYDGKNWGDGWNKLAVTYWMDLPKPPSTEGVE